MQKVRFSGKPLLLVFKALGEFLHRNLLMPQGKSLTHIKTILNCANTKTAHHMLTAAFLWSLRQNKHEILKKSSGLKDPIFVYAVGLIFLLYTFAQ